MALASSAEREDGMTLMMARRSFSSEKLGILTLTVTVLSSFFSMPSNMVRKETYRPPSAVARSKELTTSSAVTSVPSENLAPSRRVTS